MKSLDQTSPILFAHTAFSFTYPTVTLSFAKPLGETLTTVFKLVLTNAAITDVELSGASETPAESVSFHPTSWTATYWPVGSDGSLGAPISTTVVCQ